jgi:hypothetical protein
MDAWIARLASGLGFQNRQFDPADELRTAEEESGSEPGSSSSGPAQPSSEVESYNPKPGAKPRQVLDYGCEAWVAANAIGVIYDEGTAETHVVEGRLFIDGRERVCQELSDHEEAGSSAYRENARPLDRAHGRAMN